MVELLHDKGSDKLSSDSQSTLCGELLYSTYIRICPDEVIDQNQFVRT